MKHFIKDPLAHFLLAGLLLFATLSWFSEGEDDLQTIVVDRATLLSFIQYRTKVFKPEAAAQTLDAMTEEARQRLIQDYIEEEALYRESKALGLDGDDYVIRRRMVQKLEFINQGFAEQSLTISEDDLQKFFQENLTDYYIEPWITFTHVYLPFSDALDDMEEQKRAVALQKTLNEQKVSFTDSVKYGHRFPYHLNYVERTEDFVASHFGNEFAKRLFSLEQVDTTQWFGPVQSQYGLHLVKIKQLTQGRNPELGEVEAMVGQDYRTQWLRGKQQEVVDAIVDQYTIVRP